MMKPVSDAIASDLTGLGKTTSGLARARRAWRFSVARTDVSVRRSPAVIGPSTAAVGASRRPPRPSRWPLVAVLLVIGATLAAGVAISGVGQREPQPQTIEFPVQGLTRYIDSFGTPRLAGTRDAHNNVGVDIFATAGAPVLAVMDGTIVESIVDRRAIYGRTFVLAAANGDRYRYAGVSDVLETGRRVRRGEQLTRVALTITGSRPRLYLERTIRAGQGEIVINVYQQLRRAEGRPIGRIEQRVVRGIVIAADAAGPLESLLADAEAAGFRLTGSGYRSPEDVIALRRAACGPTARDITDKPAQQCSPPTARPGESALESGRAIDLSNVGNGKRLRRTDRVYSWLLVHGPRHGWYNPSASAPWRWEIGR
jgi:hypothetical protein